MNGNEEFFDTVVDEKNPMFRCDTCGHEVPEANMVVHKARCGGRYSSLTEGDLEGSHRGDEDGTTNLSDTSEEVSTMEERNVSDEIASEGNNVDAAAAPPDIEEGGAAARRERCIICMEEIEANEEMIGCAGTVETHFWHTDCGLSYVTSAVAFGGAFEGIRTQQILVVGQQEPFTSAWGELPCPSFVQGCDCAALPNDAIFRMLGNSRDTSERFMQAYRRVINREAIADQPTANYSNAAGNELPVVDQIYHRVTDALSRGYQMSCPSCRQQGTKDSECMHIHCPTCGSDWCYCCGRFRLESGPVADRCRGCDSTAIYIERQPGWGSFALLGTGEDPKTGALWEFHKRVQTYYVRHIKEETPIDQWGRFVQAYPRTLENTPTFGRHIMWDDLDSASPPVFGNSVENDLLWKLQNTQQQQQQQQQQQRGPPTPPPLEEIGSFWEVFETTKGKTWFGALLFTVLFLILKWTIGSSGLSILADTAVTATSFVGATYVLLWFTKFFAANPNHPIRQSLPEAFFLGKQNQPPFLSPNGRFRSSRQMHVYFWIGSIALGSLFIGISNELGSIPVLLIMGTTILTFGLVCSALEITIGNVSPPPDLENEPQCGIYCSFALLSAIFVLCLAVGAGLMTYESYSKVRTIGVFLLSAGIGALAAEYVPRLFRRQDTIWMPLGPATRKRSYTFFLSVTIGSSLCWLGTLGAMVAGILVLICGVVLSWRCLCAR